MKGLLLLLQQQPPPLAAADSGEYCKKRCVAVAVVAVADGAAGLQQQMLAPEGPRTAAEKLPLKVSQSYKAALAATPTAPAARTALPPPLPPKVRRRQPSAGSGRAGRRRPVTALAAATR